MDGNGRADCGTAEPPKKYYVDGGMSDPTVHCNGRADCRTAETKKTDYVEGGMSDLNVEQERCMHKKIEYVEGVVSGCDRTEADNTVYVEGEESDLTQTNVEKSRAEATKCGTAEQITSKSECGNVDGDQCDQHGVEHVKYELSKTDYVEGGLSDRPDGGGGQDECGTAEPTNVPNVEGGPSDQTHNGMEKSQAETTKCGTAERISNEPECGHAEGDLPDVGSIEAGAGFLIRNMNIILRT